MKFITDFLEKEKQRPFVVTKKYPNGVHYIYEKYTKWNRMHKFFNPLNDEQIDTLQKDVNEAQRAMYVFPSWYRDFLKTTNGLNVFFDAISFYGEQTPVVLHPKYGQIKALIERDNPDWTAPYNLRFPNSIKYDLNAQNRWLTIVSYHYDHTHIAWDFKKNKIIAMYAHRATFPIKEWKKLTESDYEKLIIAEWDDFETFFIAEMKRLSEVFKKNENLDLDINENLFVLWRKALPIGHKDFQN
ncbi:MAG: SMI1/KNR4 family protein [Chloroflexi bacterium]|nr:SMI1/KNR4 family protein [Chloroflexota bacterium]